MSRIFIKNGPQIPDELMQAHEDGEVVFFVGAGVSVRSGLPSFSCLVKQLYNAFYLKQSSEPFEAALQFIESMLVEARSKPHEAALQFLKTLLIKDRSEPSEIALQSLEATVEKGRQKVRKEIQKILTPDEKIIDTHAAILTLGKDHKTQKTRVVTTNFDLLFEAAIKEGDLEIERLVAPALPLVKNTWQGLVYLHGRLPGSDEKQSKIEECLDNLVLTSADFGRAYLTDAWATRFLLALFKKHRICFIGYSINDPVMRYIVDALAADRSLGETIPEPFIFASYTTEEAKGEIRETWETRGVIPILYSAENNHDLLHKTLHTWADAHRDGVWGKCTIVTSLANKVPLSSDRNDLDNNHMLWALRDLSGIPAQHFAKLEPTPSIAWLEVIQDLILGNNPKIRSPLEGWLLKHLDEPQLAFWATRHQAKLSLNFTQQVQQKLRKEQPSKTMALFWQLFVNGRIRLPFANDSAQTLENKREEEFAIWHWKEDFKVSGLNSTLKIQLSPLLMAYAVPLESEDKKLRLGIEYFRYHQIIFDKLEKEIPHWQTTLPELLDDFTIVLQNNLQLIQEIGYYNPEIECFSYWYGTPSISPHEKNQHRHKWAKLIDLNRDAWLETLATNFNKAKRTMEEWWSSPYLLFKRLALFAATQDKALTDGKWVDWLLEETQIGPCLWLPGMHREVMQLLYSCAANLSQEQLDNLQVYILKGPPDDMLYVEADEMIGLRLAKIQASGVNLSLEAQDKIAELSQKAPSWLLGQNQEETFPHLRTELSFLPLKKTPEELEELCLYLETNPPSDIPGERDDWYDRCIKDFSVAMMVLCKLDKKGIFQEERWRLALGIWSSQTSKGTTRIKESWDCLAKIIANWSDDRLQLVARKLGFWLKEVSKELAVNEDIFVDLCERILNLPFPDSYNSKDAVMRFDDHPVASSTLALLNYWYTDYLKSQRGLAPNLKAIFTKLCNTDIPIYRYARFLLGHYSKILFITDEEWVKENLTPLFNWQNPVEAETLWAGFLDSAGIEPRRLYESIRKDFITVPNHIDAIGEHANAYVRLVTEFSLDHRDVFTEAELKGIIQDLSEDHLLISLQCLTRCQSAATADNRGTDYWRNRSLYYLENVFPKTKRKPEYKEQFSVAFSNLVIATGDAFPEALTETKKWLTAISSPSQILYTLCHTDLCNKFPENALDFLDNIIGDPQNLLYLKKCLQQIVTKAPELKDDPRYQRLLWTIDEETETEL